MTSYLKKFRRISQIIKSFNPDILLGSEPTLTHLGKRFNIPSFVFSEDDAKVIFLFTKIAYPFADVILSPISCEVGKWECKKIGYNGYHELAYLHPNYFVPNKEVVEKYININNSYFIIRFSMLNAYHDIGKTGINANVTKKLIEMLKPHGDIYITSERELESEFEHYRLNINPIDIHHVMAFAKMYIGDSQTMAAEAAVLGTPALRFNDFVGKLGYLEELEHKYGLTYGIKTSDPDALYKKIIELLANPNLRKKWHHKRDIMLKEKIDVTAFMVWFVENYPNSARIMKRNPEYQYNFK